MLWRLHPLHDQCSPIFRRTQLEEPEPLRGRVMLFSHNMLRCFAYTYNYINAIRFSDGLCLQNWSRYERTAFYCLGNCTMYWKVSLISSCSRLCEILFHFALCDHALIANAGGSQLLFQGVACFILATVGWCPLNFALRVTRQAWLQRSGHPIISHVLR